MCIVYSAYGPEGQEPMAQKVKGASLERLVGELVSFQINE